MINFDFVNSGSLFLSYFILLGARLLVIQSFSFVFSAMLCFVVRAFQHPKDRSISLCMGEREGLLSLREDQIVEKDE